MKQAFVRSSRTSACAIPFVRTTDAAADGTSCRAMSAQRAYPESVAFSTNVIRE